MLGHRYFLKADCESVFCFETVDPPGTFVPLHVHPTQDEFIHELEGTFDLQLGDAKRQARAGDLVRMPRGVPHSYHNSQSVPARALFWVSPARPSRMKRASVRGSSRKKTVSPQAVTPLQRPFCGRRPRAATALWS